MLRIAIDGACRRNGKPDCISTGGVYVHWLNTDGTIKCHFSFALTEGKSTNQRGELLALYKALHYILDAQDDAIIITDSEYIFNAMTKEWTKRWSANGWKTAGGDAVKNRDLWSEIHTVSECISQSDKSVSYYHIKGHCIPFGAVTADRLLSDDGSGEKLYKEVLKKYITVAPTKQDVFDKAQKLSEVNNGYALPLNIFRTFVCMNTVVDAIASTEVANADARRH